LIARARITSIAATQDADATYDLTERIAAIQSNASATTSKSDHAFSLSMGDGRTVYHRLSDFKNSEAREYMQQLLDTYEEITGIENRLVKLRSSYANGSRSVGDEIVTLESRLSTARQRERQLTNTVVRLETK
jgi:predicted metal-dependent hydrolase